MGCDGGTHATRRDIVVKTKASARKVKDEDTKLAKWTVCAFSNLPLEGRVLCCRLGYLYRKGEVIEAILKDKAAFRKIFRHVRSFKDFADLKFKENPLFDDAGPTTSTSASRYVCPITDIEVDGGHKFVALWQCGHVISHKAYDQFASSHKCVVCDQAVAPGDVVTLNPSVEERRTMAAALAIRQKGEKGAASAGGRKKKRRGELAGSSKAKRTSLGPISTTERRERAPRVVGSAKKSLLVATAGSVGSSSGKTVSRDLSVPENADANVYTSLFLPAKSQTAKVALPATDDGFFARSK